jgi:hypothetical protein
MIKYIAKEPSALCHLTSQRKPTKEGQTLLQILVYRNLAAECHRGSYFHDPRNLDCQLKATPLRYMGYSGLKGGLATS